MHCPPSDDSLSQQRRSPKDIDLVCRREDRRHLRELFAARGYEVDRDLLVAMEGRRYLFSNPESGIDVDVWVDDLEFCHTLEMRDRLLLDDPTLPLEDMLLSKLQIVDLTANDRLDIRCMLDTHEVVPGSVEREEIDATHIARVLGGDWGFWRTATANLTATGSDEATSPLAASPGRPTSRKHREAAQVAPLERPGPIGRTGPVVAGRRPAQGHLLMPRARRSDEMTLFFATDLHGSELCWRKFVAAARFYGADLLILGGDFTGKLVIPLVETATGYRAEVMGRTERSTPIAPPPWSAASPTWATTRPG